MTPETGEVSTQEVAPNDTTEVIETVQSTGEEATTEAEAVPEPLKPEEDPKFASKFQVLARRERKQREERELIKQDREQVMREQHRIEQQRQFEELVKTNPIKAMEVYGITSDQVVKSLLEIEEKAPEEDPRDVRLRTVEEEIANYKKLQQENAHRAQQEQVREYVQSIWDTIDNDETDRFELIKTTGRHELARDFAVEYFNQYGKPMSPVEAAEAAEAYLLDEAQKALRASKLKKIGKPKEAAKEAPKESPTLTNDMRNAPPGNVPPALTEEERLARAAAKIRWT